MKIALRIQAAQLVAALHTGDEVRNRVVRGKAHIGSPINHLSDKRTSRLPEKRNCNPKKWIARLTLIGLNGGREAYQYRFLFILRAVLMKTGRTHCFLTVSVIAVVSLLTTSIQAAIIVDDSFADVDRTKTGALDADWWSSSSTSGNSVEIDGTGLGLVSGTSGRGIHATFAPQTLAIGDTITATVTFNTPATVGTNKGGAFRFALMDFNNAGLAADLSSSSSSANPLYVGQPGYMSDFDVNTDATADVSLRKHDILATSGRFLGTTGEWNSMGSSADNGYTFAANTEYVGVLAVTRTGADSASVFSSISQGTTLMDSHLEPDASAIANNFGMFGIWANSDVFGSTTGSDPDNGITLTNFKVEVTSVPEPSSITLLLAALPLLPSLVRRK